jgi:hypothetical protein
MYFKSCYKQRTNISSAYRLTRGSIIGSTPNGPSAAASGQSTHRDTLGQSSRERKRKYDATMVRISEISALFGRTSISSQKPIPKEIDHRKIAVLTAMMDEVKFLFVPEPVKSTKPRILHVIFLIKKDMHVKRYRASAHEPDKKV